MRPWPHGIELIHVEILGGEFSHAEQLDLVRPHDVHLGSVQLHAKLVGELHEPFDLRPAVVLLGWCMAQRDTSGGPLLRIVHEAVRFVETCPDFRPVRAFHGGRSGAVRDQTAAIWLAFGPIGL